MHLIRHEWVAARHPLNKQSLVPASPRHALGFTCLTMLLKPNIHLLVTGGCLEHVLSILGEKSCQHDLCWTSLTQFQNFPSLQEDFEAERRDRERMASEKETDKLRSNAEITSLKLQVIEHVLSMIAPISFL